jgi:hypothetical protein
MAFIGLRIDEACEVGLGVECTHNHNDDGILSA